MHEANVYWLRHKTYKAFAKEAYRYGLGDGESMINFKNMRSHIVETGLRYFFFLVLLALPLILVSGSWMAGFLLIPLSFGLRSYRNAYRNWKNVKLNFGIGVLFGA